MAVEVVPEGCGATLECARSMLSGAIALIVKGRSMRASNLLKK